MGNVKAAWAAGEAKARSYKAGDVFLGASPEAAAAGFENDPVARSAFISAYLAFLPRPIRTEWGNNVIVSVGKD